MVSFNNGGTATGGGVYESFVGVYSDRIGAEKDTGRVWKIEVVSATIERGVPITSS